VKTATIAKCWTFISSHGDRRYQTLLYVDGSPSCDRPGWCRRVAGDGSRSCRHTRAVLMGSADREAESMHDYRVAMTAQLNGARPAARSVASAGRFGEIGRRKIHA
jgi:hypothetical protein